MALAIKIVLVLIIIFPLGMVGYLWPSTSLSAGVTAANVTITWAAIPVNGTGITDVYINGVVGGEGIGAYDFRIDFDRTKVNVTGIAGGALPFDGKPTSNVSEGLPPANDIGILRFNAFHATVPGPAGNVRVARITWKSLAPGSHSLTLAVATLAGTSGVNVSVGAVINGTISTIALRTGNAGVNVGATTEIPVSVLSLPPPGLWSYVLTVSFDRTRVTVDSIGDGDFPFGPPATRTIDNGGGTVTLADSVGSGYPAGDIVLARLRIRGFADGAASLNIALTSLKDASGADITASLINGTVSVSTPVVRTAAGAVAPGGYTTVAVSVEGLAAQSLQSYDLTISFDKTRIVLESVTAGDAPFGAPASAIIDNVAGTVRLSDSVSSAFPTGNIRIAGLKFKGLAFGNSPLTIIPNNLVNSANSPVNYARSEGTVVVCPTSIETGSVFLFKGASADVLIMVKQLPGLVAGKGGLGAYSFRIDFDSSRIRVNGFSQSGADPQFAGIALTSNQNNTIGQAFVSQSLNVSAGPTGDVLLARMNITALADGAVTLALAGFSGFVLRDTAGNDISHTKTEGVVTVVAVEVGSAVAQMNTTTRIPVTVKLPASSPGLKSYALTLRFDSARIRINSIVEGDSPFGPPATKTIDSKTGTVVLAGSQTGGNPAGEVVVARFDITALNYTVTDLTTPTGTSITVTVTELTNVSSEAPVGLPGLGNPGSIIIPIAFANVGSFLLLVRGATLDIPVAVAVHHLAAPNGLGSYDITVNYDNRKINVVGVRGGHQPFNALPAISSPANASFIRFSGQHNQPSGPKGGFVIAYLRVVAQPGAPIEYSPLAITVNSLKDVSGNAVVALPLNGDIFIFAPGVSIGFPAMAPSVPPIWGLPDPEPVVIRGPGSTPTATPVPAGVVPGLPPPAPPSLPTVAPTPAPEVATPAPVSQRRPGPPLLPAPQPPPAPAVPPTVVSGMAPPAVGPNAVARDANGNTVSPSQGQTIAIISQAGGLSLVIPVPLAANSVLKSFEDPASGVIYRDNKITLPVKDALGNLQLTLIAVTGEATGAGPAAVARIEKLELHTAPVVADYSSFDHRVGRVSATVKAELKTLPPDAAITVAVDRSLIRSVYNALSRDGGASGKKLSDVAFAASVTKTNLQNGQDIGEAVVTMEVKRLWTDAYGTGNVAVVRLAEDGTSEFLPTSFKGYSGDTARFEGVSARGLSVFALVAFQPIPVTATPLLAPAIKPQSTVAPVPERALSPAISLKPTEQAVAPQVTPAPIPPEATPVADNTERVITLPLKAEPKPELPSFSPSLAEEDRTREATSITGDAPISIPASASQTGGWAWLALLGGVLFGALALVWYFFRVPPQSKR